MSFIIRIFKRYLLLTKIFRVITRFGIWQIIHDKKILPRIFTLPLIYLSHMLMTSRVKSLNKGQKLCEALIMLGGSFVKFGQILSVRPDIIGHEFADALRLLQDRVPPFESALAKEIIIKNLNKNIAEIFSEFSDMAEASASIAQVHKARLHDGTWVAVKIMNPTVEKNFTTDIDLLHFLTRNLEFFFPRTRLFKFREIIETYESWVKSELNFRREAASGAELKANLKNDGNITIPKIYWQYSNEKIFVSDWIDGIKIDERQKLIDAGHEPRKTIEQAVELFFLQVFRDGFFHADIHPGNLFVQKDGSIAAVDFGITGRLEKEMRFFLADILIGFLYQDYDLIAQVHFDLGYVPAHQSKKEFSRAMRAIGEPLFGAQEKAISFAEILINMITIAREFDMEPRLDLLLLHKTMLQAEGIGRILTPGMNIWLLAQPLIEEWLIINRNPLTKLRELTKHALPILISLPQILQNLNWENISKTFNEMACEKPNTPSGAPPSSPPPLPTFSERLLGRKIRKDKFTYKYLRPSFIFLCGMAGGIALIAPWVFLGASS